MKRGSDTPLKKTRKKSHEEDEGYKELISFQEEEEGVQVRVTSDKFSWTPFNFLSSSKETSQQLFVVIRRETSVNEPYILSLVSQLLSLSISSSSRIPYVSFFIKKQSRFTLVLYAISSQFLSLSLHSLFLFPDLSWLSDRHLFSPSFPLSVIRLPIKGSATFWESLSSSPCILSFYHLPSILDEETKFEERTNSRRRGNKRHRHLSFCVFFSSICSAVSLPWYCSLQYKERETKSRKRSRRERRNIKEERQTTARTWWPHKKKRDRE